MVHYVCAEESKYEIIDVHTIGVSGQELGVSASAGLTDC
jgi:hypothetical protein